MGGISLPYPSTGRIESNNLKEQMAINGAPKYPNKGEIIINSLNDKRMQGWLGWQKYAYNVDGTQVHYIGNRFFPK